jgi:hypothetical protein
MSLTYGLRRIALFDEKERADYFLYDGLGSVVGLQPALELLIKKSQGEH